ncbi:MAG: NADH-quinone oxidoreductase subunit NuoG [Pseudomonadota bacterium]|nr:NADH-quinone oxidoreductase subunit NuoG [Pseudomonadota bacterium]
MSDEVRIEVDGVSLPARKGQMVIEVTDEAGIYVPRFCYHKKLTVAANCRMCLVEVERAPKALPACATPVADGMKVFTRSERAVAAQKAVMEFLLINHPLDCPICDQGGECELQDLALGFGGDVSQYTERKRIVQDENLGPLISTDMTRCIHCTRCVRFGTEIAGIRELGATGRGENMEIGTYVGETLVSELAGNVIDLCPVGALTARPSRYTARPWELMAQEAVSPHDPVGSNLYVHTRGGKAMRVVPRENEAVNETWIADRDRFSYRGAYAESRLPRPMVRDAAGQWRETDWEAALQQAVAGLQALEPSRLGMLASPASTLEELYLFRRLAEGLGCTNLDHRLAQGDFRDQAQAPVMPGLGMAPAAVEQLGAVLVIGSDLRGEVPLLHLRLRKAVQAGAVVSAINARDYDYRFPLATDLRSADPAASLAAVAQAVGEISGKPVPRPLQAAVQGVSVEQAHIAIARSLLDAGSALVLLGNQIQHRRDGALVRALADFVATATGAVCGRLEVGGNSAGAWLAGVLPHRAPGGQAQTPAGLDARRMLTQPQDGYVLLNVEPELDSTLGAEALEPLAQAFVVCLTPFVSERMRQYADVLLPIGTFLETSGTYVGLAGQWQSQAGAARPLGEARPGWKVLRVLGNLLSLPGFDWSASDAVATELRQRLGAVGPVEPAAPQVLERDPPEGGLQRLASLPLYAVDSLVRRAAPLQATVQAQEARAAWVGPAEAERLGVTAGGRIELRTEHGRAELPVHVHASLAAGCIALAGGIPETADLGAWDRPVQVRVLAAEAPDLAETVE